MVKEVCIVSSGIMQLLQPRKSGFKAAKTLISINHINVTTV